MKAKKRMAVFGAVLLGVATLLCIGRIAGCRPPGLERGGFCAGVRDRGCPPVFRGKGFEEHVLSCLDRRVEELGLSNAQRKSYEEIRNRLKENLAEGKARRQGLFNAVRSEITKERPEIEQVLKIIKQGMKEFPQHFEKNTDLFVSFYGILDGDQQKQVLETLRNRMKCGQP